MLEIALEKMACQIINDTALLQLISRGDEDALATLYKRHGGKLYGYALRTLRDPALAEDVLQESLLTIWQRAKSYRGEGRVVAWLFGIVHHKAMRAYREKVNLPLDEAIQKLKNIDTQVDERIISQDRKDSLREGMEMLSVDHRTVLELVFYQEMTMKEISKICGVPVGTVKSRLNYAKTALKGVLTRRGMLLEEMS